MVMDVHFFKRIYMIYRKLAEKSYTTLSGAIAFFLVINGGSLIYLTVYISDFFKIDYPFSSTLRSISENSLNNSGNFWYTIFFLLTSIYGASSLFYHLLKTGEIIFGEANKKFNVFRRLIAVIFLSVFIFIIESFFIVLFLSKSLFSSIFMQIFRYVAFVFVTYLLALCIMFFITPHTVRYSEVRRGAFFVTCFWFLITLGFNIFLNIFQNYKAIYGALTVFVVFMIWLYLLAQVLVIGMIYNYYQKEKNVNLFSPDLPKIKMVHQKEVYEKK